MWPKPKSGYILTGVGFAYFLLRLLTCVSPVHTQRHMSQVALTYHVHTMYKSTGVTTVQCIDEESSYQALCRMLSDWQGRTAP